MISFPESTPEVKPGSRDLVGLLPAAGQARRLPPLPCSKEVYPVGFRPVGENGSPRPVTAIRRLLESMRRAGAERAYIILRQGKWDIPGYLNDGGLLDMHLAYLMMNAPHGVPFTLDQAYPFVARATVVFGFPDILFEPPDAFVRLLARQAETGADLVLGLFPAHQPHKMDMVELDNGGRVRGIRIKPEATDLRFTWILAVWTPAFTRLLHEYVAAAVRGGSISREFHVGDVIQAALGRGTRIEPVLFPAGEYLDIGTPEDLEKAVRSPFCGRKEEIP